MLTEEQGDEAHEQYLRIAAAITALLNKMTAKLSPEAEEYVRDVLGDTFRFWKN